MSTRHDPQQATAATPLSAGGDQRQSVAETVSAIIWQAYTPDEAMAETVDGMTYRRLARLDDHYDDPDAQICSILGLGPDCLISETGGARAQREMEVEGHVEDLEPLRSVPGFGEIVDDDFFDERGTARLVIDDRNPALLSLMEIRREYWANHWTREEADGFISGKYARWNLTADPDALVAARRNLRQNKPIPRSKTAAQARQQSRMCSRILDWLDDEDSTDTPPVSALNAEHTRSDLPTDFESLAFIRSTRFATEASARAQPNDIVARQEREDSETLFGGYVEMLIAKRGKESEYARIVGSEEFAHHKAKLALWQTGWNSTTACPPMPARYVGLPAQVLANLKTI